MADEARPEPTEPEVIDADSLDFGMGVAFGRPGRRPGESVAAAIERMTGASPRVLLRDAPESPSPVLRVLPAGSAERAGDDGRYQVLGEIARGGLGIVFKGRDRDLGRDVALKVLRPEYARHDAVLARFVEEAQIGGQLQHPGIVPVYSMGLESDGRPFFAMKLVKGRTLSALLSDRKSPRENVRRFLAVFEQVCRTVAYAHARRVVHRDLKPSNVMLGAFGEVQVVDWGLAKVLGREDGAPERPAAAPSRDVSLIETVRSGSDGSASQAGSVMGTPGYMSPEQALGREIDEKTDVFALGAILCTILTGDAPFTGEERDQVLLAAQGRLDDAHARLAACGADAELVAIATKCLAPAPADRPRDAGVVAEEISKHLSDVESRTREGEIAAAAAHAKADEERARAVRENARSAAERSAHRRTIALAAVVITIVAGAGGVWLRLDSEEAQRLARTAESVSRAMAESSDRRGARDFAGAVAAAKKAVALAKTGDADEDTSARAAKLLADAEADERAAVDAAARAAADAAFLAKLDSIRERRADALEARQGADAEFSAAFREAGFDVDGAEAASVAQRIRSHGAEFATQAASALDEWAWLRRTKGSLKASDAVRPGEVARLADPDDWRNRVRDAGSKRDVAVLRELAARADTASLPAATMDLVGKLLGDAGDWNAGAEFLGRAQSQRAGDFWITLHLAYALERCRPPRHEDAICHLTAAVALRPSSPIAWFNLGSAKRLSGDKAGAAAAYREGVRLAPDSAVARTSVANDLLDGKDVAGAIAAAREAVTLDPESLRARRTLAMALAANRDAAGALGEAQEVVRRQPGNAEAHGVLGAVLWALRDAPGARAAFEEALRLDPDSSAGHNDLGMVLSDGLRLHHEASVQFREALRLSLPDAASATPHANLALSLLSSGDADAAIVEAREAIRLDPSLPYAHRNLGMSLLEKGDLEGACRELAEAIRLDPSEARNHADLGSVLLQERDVRAALPHLREAIRLDPDLVPPRHNLSLALISTADTEGAVSACREAVRRRPDCGAFHADLGWALWNHGDTDGATLEYREALRLDPRDAWTWIQWGQLLRALKDRQGSVDAFDEAVRLWPQSADAWAGFAHSLSSFGDLTAAVDAADRALRLRPRDSHALTVRGMALCNLGRLQEGTADLHLGREIASRRGNADQLALAEGNLTIAERFVALDARLPDVLRGEFAGLDHFDVVWCLDAGSAHDLNLAAVRLARRAFAADADLPDDKTVHARTAAARNAALAAAGAGDAAALGAPERAAFRASALEWLRADLALQVARIGSGAKGPARIGRSRLLWWNADPAFASVRGDELAALSADERTAWSAFWSDVDAALKSAEAK